MSYTTEAIIYCEDCPLSENCEKTYVFYDHPTKKMACNKRKEADDSIQRAANHNSKHFTCIRCHEPIKSHYGETEFRIQPRVINDGAWWTIDHYRSDNKTATPMCERCIVEIIDTIYYRHPLFDQMDANIPLRFTEKLKRIMRSWRK